MEAFNVLLYDSDTAMHAERAHTGDASEGHDSKDVLVSLRPHVGRQEVHQAVTEAHVRVREPASTATRGNQMQKAHEVSLSLC